MRESSDRPGHCAHVLSSCCCLAFSAFKVQQSQYGLNLAQHCLLVAMMGFCAPW